MMQDQNAYKSIIRARTSLILNHPFFASLSLRLTLQEDRNCHTAWTDGKVFAYNPEYINILSQAKIEGLAAHLVMHPACNHHKRRQGRDPKMWNRACDYAINWILLDAGFTLPDAYLYLEEYRGRSAENVYEILYQGQGEDDSDEDAEENDTQHSDQEEQEKQDEQSKNEQSESGNDDDTLKEEQQASNGDPGLSREIRDADDESANESSSTEIDWDEAFVQAAQNAREIGKLPVGVACLFDKKINPKLNWQELLARFIERFSRSDYSWLTPNRRYIHQGLYFPSLSNSELNQIVIGVDTSGSIAPDQLSQFAAEISGIMEQYPASIHLIYCDIKVHDCQVFERADLPVKIDPKGGGGTDFRPVFRFIEKEGLNPACVIYLTDMECISFPGFEPDYPVLWVKVGTSLREPPFGEVLNL